MPTSEVPDRTNPGLRRLAGEHRNALISLFEAVGSMSDEELSTPSFAITALLHGCRGYIARETPCGRRSTFAAELFIARVNWAGNPLLRGLFREYVAAGLIDPNGPLVTSTADNAGVLPLEMAIIQGNMDAVEAFIAAGADIRRVPTREWTKTMPVDDIYDLIEAKTPVPARVEPMKALVREMSMRRRIDDALAQGAPNDTAGEPSPSVPRRRQAL